MNSSVIVKPDIEWQGASGTSYGYWIRPIYTSWQPRPGNYIYAKETLPGRGQWVALYIGQSENLSMRLANREMEAEVVHHGATHIHAHGSAFDVELRMDEVRDLILKLNPQFNLRV